MPVSRTRSRYRPAPPSVGAGLSYLGMMIPRRPCRPRLHPGAAADLEGWHPRPAAGHRRLQARPLAGLWADRTVPPQRIGADVYDLLSPVADRRETFRVVSREYDPLKLGLKLPESGFWLYDRP